MTARDDRTDKMDFLTMLRERIPLGRLTVLTGKPHAVREVILELARDHALYVHVHDEYREYRIRTAIRAAAQDGAQVVIDTFEYGLHYSEIEAALEKALRRNDHARRAGRPDDPKHRRHQCRCRALQRAPGRRHPADEMRTEPAGSPVTLSPKEIRIAVKQGIEVR